MTQRHCSRISSKGQLTLPVAVRQRLGVRPGNRVEFVAEGSRTVVRPVRENLPSFAEDAGMLGNLFPRGRSQVNAWLRSLRDEGE